MGKGKPALVNVLNTGRKTKKVDVAEAKDLLRQTRLFLCRRFVEFLECFVQFDKVPAIKLVEAPAKK
jgi:hypothetical protein